MNPVFTAPLGKNKQAHVVGATKIWKWATTVWKLANVVVHVKPSEIFYQSNAALIKHASLPQSAPLWRRWNEWSSSTCLPTKPCWQDKIIAIDEQVNTLAHYIRLEELAKQACGLVVYLVICHCWGFNSVFWSTALGSSSMYNKKGSYRSSILHDTEKGAVTSNTRVHPVLRASSIFPIQIELTGCRTNSWKYAFKSICS